MQRAAAAAAILATACVPAGGETSRFIVTDRIVAMPSPSRLTATVDNTFGAGARFTPFGGFEPGALRLRLEPQANAPDQVVLSPTEADQYETLREGALDGAEVDVLRIESGAMRLVRHDRVAEGGHMASGWRNLTRKGKLIAPQAHEMTVGWRRWERPDAPIWFSLRAVSASGARSAAADAVASRSPADMADGGTEATWVSFDIPEEEGRGAAPAAPRDLRARALADGRIKLSWATPEGAAPAGYELLRAYASPEAFKGFGLRLAGDGPPVRKGDMVFVRRLVDSYSRRTFLNDRVWNAGPTRRISPPPHDIWSDEDPDRRALMMPHEPGDPVTEGGRSYLRLELGPSATETIRVYNHASMNQDYYEVLRPGTYHVSFWIRSVRPGLATFRLRGTHQRDVRPIRVASGPEWRKVEIEFTIETASRDDRGVGAMELIFAGPNRFDIDNFRVHPADVDWMGLSAQERMELSGAGLSALRAHQFVRTGIFTYDLEKLLDRGAGDGSMPFFLRETAALGLDPWLQVEPHLSDAEWLGLAEWLAGPAGSGEWADMRASQGQAAPWTDGFGKIYLEIGNETWNRIFAPWTFPPMQDAASGKVLATGTVYGLFQERVVELLRGSPHWPALRDKLEFVVGGWNRRDYGRLAAEASPSTDHMTVATYLGGWDEDEPAPTGTPSNFFSILNHVNQAAIPYAEQHAAEVAQIGRARGRPLGVGTYEGGPGYVRNGLNGARVTDEERALQERVMKSQAAGVATLDELLAQAERGYGLQNFFLYKKGGYWSSHAWWHEGGQAWPSWKLWSLYDNEGRGDFLEIDTQSVPVADFPKRHLRRAVEDAPLVGVYATRAQDRLNVFVISRRTPGFPDAQDDGCGPVEISLPIRGAASLTVHRMDGPYDAHNIGADRVKIETEALPLPVDPARLALGIGTGAKACGLPPGSVYLYVYEGVTD
jgi:hypothetical protein